MKFEQELKIIRRGTEEIITEEDMISKLKKAHSSGNPLRIKYGIDPTGYDVHIGHLVPIRKMREFQDLGHLGVIIIGDFTARIGDPTGRDESRPPLTPEEIKKNAEKYMDQLYTVLDPKRTEVRWQTEWFGGMSMSDVLRLMGKYTLAQFMAHDTFRRRYEEGLALGMHELMYPILQAYDSVAVAADVELGATEQKFNILAGRDMQHYFAMEEQVAILSPILMGTDGKEKMSKSLNNYIAVFDPPAEKYGKVMSIPDDLILNYFNHATLLPQSEIEQIGQQLQNRSINPMLLKKRLAREIVSLYHGREAATAAEAEFEQVFSMRENPDNMQEYMLGTDKIGIIELLVESGICSSSGEVRRMIRQNAISIDGNKITDIFYKVGCPGVVKVGKRRFLKVIKQDQEIL
ncbi:MAG: tyrosine--tRNA ligase [Candidatus Cloacimonetes bacterium]|nr:tyrosine--tRNA ligase [Candidatus Cloacimonadota bacterium]